MLNLHVGPISSAGRSDGFPIYTVTHKKKNLMSNPVFFIVALAVWRPQNSEASLISFGISSYETTQVSQRTSGIDAALALLGRAAGVIILLTGASVWCGRNGSIGDPQQRYHCVRKRYHSTNWMLRRLSNLKMDLWSKVVWLFGEALARDIIEAKYILISKNVYSEHGMEAQ